MIFIEETYVHNQLVLDEEERNILISASKIISDIQQANTDNDGAKDGYLFDLCADTLNNISQLLDNYHNSYPNDTD